MNNYLTAVKDILVILSPILIAYISYRSNKKTKKELQREIEKTVKEKDAETSQILQRISAELESQKQLASWNNSLPQTNEYTKLAGVERYGNISSLSMMVTSIRSSLIANQFTIEDLREIKRMMKRINLPGKNDCIYPYEIPYLILYSQLVRDIDLRLQEAEKTL